MNIADLPDLLVQAGIATPEQARTLAGLIEERTREAWVLLTTPTASGDRTPSG